MLLAGPGLFSLVFWLAVAIPRPAQGQDWVAAAKRVMVTSLDSTLPAVPLERWLTELSGLPSSGIKWEVNDCGEGGDGRQAPTCVEAILTFTGDTTAHLSLAVADVEGRRMGQPGVWDLSVGARNSFRGFRTLREWASQVRPQ